MRGDVPRDEAGEPAEARPPRPAEERHTQFVRRPMVQWLDPPVLADTALRVVASSLFGAYADKREFQAVTANPPYDHTGEGEPFWLDFVADLGDGFDATYAVACLLAREQLTLVEGDRRYETSRGRVLVMGGDQVYPTATRRNYEDRFRGPYGAALPWVPPGGEPDLYAIPGNHDWYDGLTNFLRFFCRDQWIGGWRTRQRRSYFGLALPHRWWLLALDIQLDTYIDEPQLAYFRDLGLAAGDRVILATGKPSWVKVRPGSEPDSYRNLRYFKEQVIQPSGAELAVILTGDLHHYCRYSTDDGSHLITAGGGGAYLFPTHTMPEELTLPDSHATYERGACYPRRETSERLAWGALRLPRLAPRLCAVLAVLDALFAAALYAALDTAPGWAVAASAVGLIVVVSVFGFAAAESLARRLVHGGLHALAQLGLASAAPLLLVLLLGVDGPWGGLAAAVTAAAIGFLLGGVAFGLYLVLSHRHAPRHANDVFACQSIADHKCFLRLRIDQRGLTIYPVGLPRVPRRWRLAPDRPAGSPWFEPLDAELEWELIESPIAVGADDR